MFLFSAFFTEQNDPDENKHSLKNYFSCCSITGRKCYCLPYWFVVWSCLNRYKKKRKGQNITQWIKSKGYILRKTTANNQSKGSNIVMVEYSIKNVALLLNLSGRDRYVCLVLFRSLRWYRVCFCLKIRIKNTRKKEVTNMIGA